MTKPLSILMLNDFAKILDGPEDSPPPVAGWKNK